MRKLTVLRVAVFAAVAIARSDAAVAQPGPERPNIILVMGDDYGWPYYNFMWQHLSAKLGGFHPGGATPECPAGSPANDQCQMHISTPNLDRLAREGIAFQHGYSAEAACQPAHESLYTGLQQRDLAAAGKVGCDPGGAHGAQTFPEVLRNNGYNTFYAGRFYGPKGANVWTEQADDREIGERKSLSALKEFISRQESDTPWFALWTPLSPHQEFASIPEHIDEDYLKWPNASGHTMETKNPPHITSVYSPSATRNYFEAITYFDERIGELVEFLELLEARTCDLGASHPADTGYSGIGPTVHDPSDPNNPLTVNGANERIVKDVACTTTPGQPCPSAPSCVPNVAAACQPNPYYDPYGTTSSGPFPTPTPNGGVLAHENKCLDQAAPPASQYAGFRRNTLIVYIMDNGSGIQHAKGQFSENGLRTPIIVNYPNRIPPLGRLSPNDESVYPHPALVGSIDIFPTVLEYAGVAPRVFPDARSFKSLAEDPWQNYPANWRRYFYSNVEPSATSMLAVTDSVLSAPFAMTSPASASIRRQFKIEANNNVLLNNSVKRISDLTTDPFENNASKPADFLPNNMNGPKYDPADVPSGTPELVVPHLQAALNAWDHCLDTCQRCKVVTELAEVACGASPEACGACTVPSLPCSYHGG